MFQVIINWLTSNPIEILAAFFGLAAVFFQYRQSYLLWPFSIAASILYGYVFISSGVLALGMLQIIYFFISLLGFYWWKFPRKNKKELQVGFLSKKEYVIILAVFIISVASIFFILKTYTNSTIPIIDSLATSFCIIASILLARKKTENWIAWGIADSISVFINLDKDLYASAVYYFVLFIVAFFGFYHWKKKQNQLTENS